MDTYRWDDLVTYRWDVVGCFIWDLFETSWRRTDETSSLRPLETWSRPTNKTSWRRTTETAWRRSNETSWVFRLRRICDVAGTYKETSLRRRHNILLPGGRLPYFAIFHQKLQNIYSAELLSSERFFYSIFLKLLHVSHNLENWSMLFNSCTLKI